MDTKRRIATAGMATGLLASLLVTTSTSPATANGVDTGPDVTPTLVAGNPNCRDLGFDYGFKPNAGGDEDAPGTFTTPIGQVSWTATRTKDDGDITELSWTSDPAASAVIVKGGPEANSYVYDPPAPSTGDSGLVPPGTAGVSHVEFCYYFRPLVSKTATTSFKRTWDWDIDKVGDQTELTLTAGQKFLVNYTVDVTKVGPVDSDFNVSGVITITNPWPVALSVTSVTDSLVTGEVACSASTVPANGGSVTCPYSADVATGAGGTNTATVKTKAGATAPERTTTGTAPYAFATPTTELHECVVVTDDKVGLLGETCATKRFTYSIEVGPYSEDSTFVNTACFESTEYKPISECDDHTVVIKVPKSGCTLTQGYWKTHSNYGPAPYDDAWLAVGGPNTTFFQSGKTWYQAFWTPPAGNAYWILAHQYMAAKLNVLNGASAPAGVTSALANAETFFASKTPSSSLTKAKTNEIKQLAATLDAYNNGLTGPGHCSE